MRYDLYNLAIAIRRIPGMEIEVDGVVQMAPAGQAAFDLCLELLPESAERLVDHLTEVAVHRNRQSRPPTTRK